ncbi:MAG: GDSL-type esterase/lipase family protein [Pseudomonadota bacterium]|nr:GDSL-type esterase/lipase family protein [Pseudomonadota bacterium]
MEIDQRQPGPTSLSAREYRRGFAAHSLNAAIFGTLFRFFRQVRPYLAGAICAILSACDDAPPTIQFFGDSITMLEADALKSSILGAEIRASNGARVGALILGRTSLEGPWPSEVTAPVAVLAYGVNDSSAWHRTPIDEYKDRYRRLVAVAPARMILATPLPTTTSERPTEAYAIAVREVAAELGLQVIDTHACFRRMPKWQQHLPDGVHPDSEAVMYLVDVCIVPALKPGR